jgi:hypothetical protein
MKDVELTFAPRAFGLDVHAFEQLSIALRIKHDADLAAANVLSDKKFGQSGFAHTRCPQYQGVANPFGQGQGDIDFLRIDAVQPGQTAYWR